MRRQRAQIPQPLRGQLINQARQLYGDRCCYCNWLMRFKATGNEDNGDDLKSIEHIVNYNTMKLRGAKDSEIDHINNILLAHRLCNAAASQLSIEEKEYYIANPDKFIKDILNGKPVYLNKSKISYRRR